MKSTVDAKAFYTAVQTLTAVTKACSIPALSEVSASFFHNRCVLRATDMETWMQIELPAQGDAFDFLFQDSSKVKTALRHLDGALTLELRQSADQSLLAMHAGNKGGKFSVLTAEDVPVRPTFEPKQTYTANAADILSCVKQVKYAANPRNTRTEYQGILFQGTHIWAVDGYRAACCDDGGLDVQWPFSVRASALEQLKAFGNAEMQIDVGEQYILFRTDTMQLATRLVAGAYAMTYEQVVPKAPLEEFRVDRKELTQALQYLLACAGSKDQPSVRFCNGEVLLQTKNASYRAHVALSEESFLMVGFDARLMLDALRQFEKQDTVAIRLAGEYTAITLMAATSSALVLPVRLSHELKQAA